MMTCAKAATLDVAPFQSRQLFPDAGILVKLYDVERLSPIDFDGRLFNGRFPQWTYSFGNADDDSITFVYSPRIGNEGGRKTFELDVNGTYNLGLSDTNILQNPNFVQVLTQNTQPIRKDGSDKNPPKFDLAWDGNRYVDQTKPFYYPVSNRQSVGTQFTQWGDIPTRYVDDIRKDGIMQFAATTHYVKSTGTALTVKDGFFWGTTVLNATKGVTSTGVFNDTSGMCGIERSCTGDGTGFFSSNGNSIKYTGRAFDPEPTETFIIGTLEINNLLGQFGSGTQELHLTIMPIMEFDLEGAKAINSDIIIKNLAGTIVMAFAGFGFSGALEVESGKVGMVDLLAKFESGSIKPQRLGEAATASEIQEFYQIRIVGFENLRDAHVVPLGDALWYSITGVILLATMLGMKKHASHEKTSRQINQSGDDYSGCGTGDNCCGVAI